MNPLARFSSRYLCSSAIILDPLRYNGPWGGLLPSVSSSCRLCSMWGGSLSASTSLNTSCKCWYGSGTSLTVTGLSVSTYISTPRLSPVGTKPNDGRDEGGVSSSMKPIGPSSRAAWIRRSADMNLCPWSLVIL